MGKYNWDLAAFRHNGNTYLTKICAHSVTLIKEKIMIYELTPTQKPSWLLGDCFGVHLIIFNLNL